MQTPSIVPQIFRNQALGTTPVRVGLSGPCSILGWRIVNLNATDIAYLKFYDTVSAPTVGTTVPIAFVPVLSVGVSAADILGTALNGFVPRYYFQNSLWVADTKGIADTDTTSPSTFLDVQIQFVQ